jgi:mRNA-degrading endonuclease RelE of RelBE toxin-antitoxin system
MDLIQKFLKRLDAKRQASVRPVLDKIYTRDFAGLDIKKLKGYQNTFRVRKGKLRILFSIENDDSIKMISIEFRNDNTY